MKLCFLTFTTSAIALFLCSCATGAPPAEKSAKEQSLIESKLRGDIFSAPNKGAFAKFSIDLLNLKFADNSSNSDEAWAKRASEVFKLISAAAGKAPFGDFCAALISKSEVLMFAPLNKFEGGYASCLLTCDLSLEIYLAAREDSGFRINYALERNPQDFQKRKSFGMNGDYVTFKNSTLLLPAMSNNDVRLVLFKLKE